MSPIEREIPPIPKVDPSSLLQDPTACVRQLMEKKRDWFAMAFDAGAGALEINRAHAECIDGIVGALYRHAATTSGGEGGAAVLALGGYGRREMGLMSDIDLLFLHAPGSSDDIRRITAGILYPFWDSGAEVGGASRTLPDCESIMNRDLRALTAMMEARLICGDESLFESLSRAVVAHLSSPRRKRFYIDRKIEERAGRLKSFGHSIYLLQPNVKEGEGGLRDYHTLIWVAKAAYPEVKTEDMLEHIMPSRQELENINASLDFIWRVRNALHLMEKKRTDRLGAALQEDVAARLGFVAEGDMRASERLMSAYYEHTGALHSRCSRSIEMIRRGVSRRSRAIRWIRRSRICKGIVRTEYGTISASPNAFKKDRMLGLRMFAAAKRRGLAIDAEAKDIIARFAPLAARDIRGNPEAKTIWREIFSSFKNLESTLTEMQGCGLLEICFPEVRPMFHRVQHDGFHLFIAGVHSIRAVGEIAYLAGRRGRKEFPIPAGALDAVDRPDSLAVATLFHDIGKGGEGDHTIAGAAMVEGIARRLGFSQRDVDDIAYLVRSHLLMSTLAFRRDIRDGALITRFAHSIRSTEMLAMLYLLTFADLKSVGPRLWSDWKGGLLAELYLRTKNCLTAGEGAWDKRRGEAARKTEAVGRSLGRDVDEKEIASYLSALPERYLFSTDSATIASHIMMSQEMAHKPLSTTCSQIPERGCTEFSIVTRDAPGLFAKIAGVLTANSANILDAQLFTSTRGIAIDVLRITDPIGNLLDDPKILRRIRTQLAAVITGEVDIDRLVTSRFKRRFLSLSGLRRPTEVVVDNDVSAMETVVEITADDRRGLLYTIASTFHELGCTIDRARVTTHVDRVIDVFYIRDEEGKKITDRADTRRIHDRLMEALEE